MKSSEKCSFHNYVLNKDELIKELSKKAEQPNIGELSQIFTAQSMRCLAGKFWLYESRKSFEGKIS